MVILEHSPDAGSVFWSGRVGGRGHAQGFPQPRWGAHFNGRAQECLLDAAANHDARVTALETACVQVTPQAHEQGVREVDQCPCTPDECSFSPRTEFGGVGSDLEVFQIRFPVLQSCPFQFRGRYRQAARTALQERGSGTSRSKPEQAREFQPETPVSIDRKVFLQCLKSTPRGSSPGPAGCTYEHFSNVIEALIGARLTALAKFDGEELRVSVLACTRADCVGHFLRATDADPRAMILSDGVGTCDHALRSAMLERVLHMPKARTILFDCPVDPPPVTLGRSSGSRGWSEGTL